MRSSSESCSGLVLVKKWIIQHSYKYPEIDNTIQPPGHFLWRYTLPTWETLRRKPVKMGIFCDF
jgi:hypothetical protein